VDVFCLIRRTPGGVYSYDGLTWSSGVGSFYFSGPLLDMTDTILDQIIPQGNYDAYLVLDPRQNGVLDRVFDYDTVDFQVVP
jgi:hypothetical protein